MNYVIENPVRWLNRMSRDFNSGQGNNGQYPIRMDAFEEKDKFEIVAELPGMNKNDISIKVDSDVLTISGEKKKSEREGREVWSERFHGEFTRSFRLPDSIDKSGVSADYKDGLLIISLPKKEELKPRNIEVKVN